MRILIISNTPLVNSPYNFKKAFNLLNFNTDLVYLNKYPKNKDFFDEPDFYYSKFMPTVKKYDLILFNNIFDTNFINNLVSIGKKNILLIHTTPFDGPVYDQFHLNDIEKYFDKIFSLSQGHCRFYPNSNLFFNIISSPGFNQDLSNDFPININYTSSLSSFGRFGSKNPASLYEEIKNFISSFSKNKVNLTKYSNLRSSQILKLKSFSHISIDDIFSGSFHQNTLEALATGGIALNGADDFTLISFMSAIETNEIPPFVTIKNSMHLFQTLFYLIENSNYLKKLIIESRDYYNSFLLPRRLIEIFLKKIYE